MKFSEIFETTSDTLAKSVDHIVEAHVARIERDQAILDVGLKSDAVVPLDQFVDEEGKVNLSEGDVVRVVLESVDGGVGLTQVSREKARRAEAMETLERAHQAGEILKGRVAAKIRGGYQIEIDSLRAFLPGSLVGGARGSRESFLQEGQVIEFKVNSISKEKNNIIVSRRAVTDVLSTKDREDLRKRIYEGAVIEGVVKNMTDYGAFVDLGGVDGLLHNFDISWRRVRHPSELLAVDQKVQVKVLKFDPETDRVSLGMKQLKDDPWVHAGEFYTVNSIHKATVTNITNYGFFAELEEGIEGLVHVSEIDWTNRNIHPSRVVEPGDQVDVMILNVNPENRRMSLGMKQCKPNPWEQFAQDHKIGDVIHGKVNSVTDFGLFVSLGNNIDGLIHSSDISWEPIEASKLAEKYKKDDEIDAVIAFIDVARERVSLSLKRMTANPVGDFLAKHPEGSQVEGRLENLDSGFALVHLDDNVVGQIRKGELSFDAKVGNTLSFYVVGLDQRRNLITLSLNLPEGNGPISSMKHTADEVKARSTTLGDLLKQEIGRE